MFSVGFATPEKDRAALEKGEIDLAMFARALWADPTCPTRSRKGPPRGHSPLQPLPNVRRAAHERDAAPPLPREPGVPARAEMAVVPAETKKKGAGGRRWPAGLEAARVAAERDHEVTLCGRNPVLALELNLATMVKGTVCENVPALIDWLASQAKRRRGLPSRPKRRWRSDLRVPADAVIVATGRRVRRPTFRAST